MKTLKDWQRFNFLIISLPYKCLDRNNFELIALIALLKAITLDVRFW